MEEVDDLDKLVSDVIGKEGEHNAALTEPVVNEVKFTDLKEGQHEAAKPKKGKPDVKPQEKKPKKAS